MTSGETASSVLLEAADIVRGARNATHGDKERSFLAIAWLWNAYLESRPLPGEEIRAFDVAQMMVLMKMARANQGQAIRDHFVDQAGYSAIAAELSLSLSVAEAPEA